MTDDSERQRLEAIVFGRDAAVSDAEREAASEELARLTAAQAAGLAETVAEAEPDPHARQGGVTEPETERLPSRRRRVLITILGVGFALTIAVVVITVAVLGRPLGARQDSMAIFDRPQTEEDRSFPDQFDQMWMVAGSVRFVGSEEGYDVFVFLQDVPAQPPMLGETTESTATPEPSDETIRMACMVVIENAQTSTSGRCGTPEEFAAGYSIAFTSGGVRADVSWNLDDGLVVVTETIPPIPPADSVFDEDQDDADLNSLLYLPDVPVDQQDTVRYLGTSGDHSLAAFRNENGAICLAVYDAGTTLATSESSCVPVAVFALEGIELLYPGEAPTVVVKWGPYQGFTVSGR